MTDRKTLLRLSLGSALHANTGKVIHRRHGAIVPEPAVLEIIQYSGDAGFYLIHFSADGVELTDTYHDTVAEALEQANYEFGCTREQWMEV
jgi:hypothetical protein